MEINWGLRFEEPLLPRCRQLGSNSRAITLDGRVREFEHSDPVPDDGGVQVLCLSVISSGVDCSSRYLQCTEKGSVHGGYCPVCHRILVSMIFHTDQYASVYYSVWYSVLSSTATVCTAVSVEGGLNLWCSTAWVL